ncbi:hypothetical protein N9M39_00565 [Halieaceae bacterium]|nr:hypothetical protein [Halieaceae bacterium]
MKNAVSAVTGALAVAVSMGFSGNVQSQERAAGAAPVEMFICRWQEGKDMDDLRKVVSSFNKWADKHDAAYTAWTITPQFRSVSSPDDVFHVGWIGAWPDGASMGGGMDAWMSEGGDVAASMAEVVDCSSAHMLAASYVVSAPDGPPDNGIVWFSSCTLEEGATLKDALAAHSKVSADMKAMGSKSSTWAFVPTLGAGDIEFDYYQVVAHDSYADLGANFDRWFNGGAGAKARAAMDGVASCDSPRLYDAALMRDGSQD